MDDRIGCERVDIAGRVSQKTNIKDVRVGLILKSDISVKRGALCVGPEG